MSVSGVSDAAIKQMVKHPFFVIFVDIIFFAEHGKGMAAVVGRMLLNPHIFKGVIYLRAKYRNKCQTLVSKKLAGAMCQWHMFSADRSETQTPPLRRHFFSLYLRQLSYVNISEIYYSLY